MLFTENAGMKKYSCSRGQHQACMAAESILFFLCEEAENRMLSDKLLMFLTI
jgi:hypothetical protein